MSPLKDLLNIFITTSAQQLRGTSRETSQMTKPDNLLHIYVISDLAQCQVSLLQVQCGRIPNRDDLAWLTLYFWHCCMTKSRRDCVFSPRLTFHLSGPQLEPTSHPSLDLLCQAAPHLQPEGPAESLGLWGRHRALAAPLSIH